MNAFDYFFSNSNDLDKEFVLGPKEKVSFHQVYQDSLKIACYLKTTLGENKNIVLISPNSVFFIICYLGIIKSGNICVPLNPSIEQSNLDYIVQSINPDFAFIAGNINLDLTISNHSKLCETGLEKVLANHAIDRSLLLDDFSDDRIAEILFTSGSTDFPKGVMLSHLNICSNTESIIEYLQLKQSDIIGVVLPFSYCYGLSLLHTHLRVGGSVVLINDFIFLGSVINDLKKYKCTGFAGVPSHFQILLRKSQTFTKTDFPDLRYVTQAGGKLHNIFIEEFIESFPDLDFFVMYGQTEATARLAFLSPELLKTKLGSIGKAIPGVELKILDEQHCPVPIDEVGEVVAKGDNIMIGYYNDTETTRQVIKDGWLYTGDLGKMDKDGFIYLVGRKKEIIKVGGRRVSPKEIEAVILSVPEVMDCTIEGVYDELLGEAIKANVVLKESCDKAQKKDEILRICSQKLSLFKIPQIIHFEDVIKVNSSGKKIKNAGSIS